MKAVSIAAVVVLTFLVGCSSEPVTPPLDNDPTVLGMTPELRRELRMFIAETQPGTDVEQIVKEFMDGLRRAVDELEIQPNEAGDYVLPDDMQKAIAPARDGDVMQIVEEFDMTLPGWAQPLVDEYKAGTISEQRKELLIIVIYGTLIPKLA